MAKGAYRVLIVDDDDVSRALIEMSLVRYNIKASSAADGAIALELLQRETFDLLITDIVLPEADGYEVIQNAQRWQPDIKILAVSGGDHKRLPSGLALDVAAKMGIDGALAKPFTPDELIHAVEAIRHPPRPK